MSNKIQGYQPNFRYKQSPSQRVMLYSPQHTPPKIVNRFQSPNQSNSRFQSAQQFNYNHNSTGNLQQHRVNTIFQRPIIDHSKQKDIQLLALEQEKQELKDLIKYKNNEIKRYLKQQISQEIPSVLNENDIYKLLEQNDQNSLQIKELQTQQQQMTLENKKISIQLRQKNEECEQNVLQIQVLQKDLETIKTFDNSIQGLEQKLQQILDKNNNLNQIVQSLMEKNQQQELEHKEKQLELTCKLQDKIKSFDVIQVQLKDLLQLNSLQQQQIQILNEENEKSQNKSRDHINQSNSEIQQLKNIQEDYQNARDIIQIKTEENQSLKEKIIQIQEQFNQQDQNNDQLVKENKILSSQIKSFEEKCNELLIQNKKLSKYSEENKLLISDNKILTEELIRLDNILKTIQQQAKFAMKN